MKKWRIGIESWLKSDKINIYKWEYEASANEIAVLTVTFEAVDYAMTSDPDDAIGGILDLTMSTDHPLFVRVGGVTDVHIETIGHRRAKVKAVFHLKEFYTSYESAAAAEMQTKIEGTMGQKKESQ